MALPRCPPARAATVKAAASRRMGVKAIRRVGWLRSIVVAIRPVSRNLRMRRGGRASICLGGWVEAARRLDLS